MQDGQATQDIFIDVTEPFDPGAANAAAQEAQQAQEAQEAREAVPVSADGELAKALEKAQAERDEYLAMAQRMKADFENYKKRKAADGLEQYENGRLAVIRDILPIADNLERAAEAAADEATKAGVQLVLKQFTDQLGKWGVAEINRLGEAFDPNLENAVMRGEPGNGEPGAVIQVLQKGYRLGDRVLRHAMVKVGSE